jgi:hypothetical protein
VGEASIQSRNVRDEGQDPDDGDMQVEIGWLDEDRKT